jgi:hypothetical protein
MRHDHRVHCGFGPERGFPGQRARLQRGEAIVWAAALEPACAARAALVEKPFTLPGGVRRAICRIVESSKSRTDFDDATATKFLTHSFFSGCTNWPGLKRARARSARPVCSRL